MSQLRDRLEPLTLGLTLVLAGLWAATFGWLAVVRHLAGGSHAEDLGFTDQVLWNVLHGHWFEMSVYQGASWDTELDLGQIARADSLLAFHFEPMLVLLAPIYALAGGVIGLLVVQAAALAAGALPAYRLGGGWPGVAVATAYLLSPLGQWAALSDFHTSTLAAPLLVLAAERLTVAHRPGHALAATILALSAREDVGPAVVLLGCVFLLRRQHGRAATAMVVFGVASFVLAAFVIHQFSGGVTPFAVRYGPAFGEGPLGLVASLTRSAVVEYIGTIALTGGWLALLAPTALLPMLPTLGLNVLSSSPWMAAGQAHYSALVLPFVAFGAAAGLRRLAGRPTWRALSALGLTVGGLVAYAHAGAGPLGGDFAPAQLTSHAARAAMLASSLPPDAAVSASSPLVPRVSQRSRVYVFPAIEDADYIFVDVKASPAPTSAGDVYLRLRDLLASGAWNLETRQDGLLLLERAGAPGRPVAPAPLWNGNAAAAPGGRLLSASLVPSPDGAVDVDGPRWILRTTWVVDRFLPPATRLAFHVSLHDGEVLDRWDVADLWWNPPDNWPPGDPQTVDVPDIPIREFASWQASWSGS